MNTLVKRIFGVKNFIVLAGFTALAACSSAGTDVPRGLPNPGNTTQPQITERPLSPNPSGEVVGSGNVRLALLVPSSIPGGAAAAAKELANGAKMAVQDFGQGRIQLVIKDTKGQAAESQSKASQAIAEGSSAILGPLFAANVSAASGVTLPANVPVLAFSTDTTVARRNVYLFSFTPQSDTIRIVSYAAQTGSRSIVAFLPRNAEGALRGRILRQQASRSGVIANIIEYERTPQGIEAVLASGSAAALAADSIYVPEGGPIPALILNGLKRNGVNPSSKRILGSGAWESVKASEPVLSGAIYPGRDVSRFNDFAQRYQGKFGARPGVQAALAYDAVTLMAELVKIHGKANAFSNSNLENSRGFQGTTGAFKILSNGTTQRGLAIYTFENGRGRLLEPAVGSFSGRS